MASAFASAVDGGMVVSDAVTTAVNEGLAAMEGEQTQAGKQTRQDVLTRCLQRSFCCSRGRN